MVRHGFHAASMAEIAGAARMSVGQIYRYFPNKEAIIHAIVERIVAQRLQGMMVIAGSADLKTALAQRLATGATDDERRDDQILMLEVTAEATRNPAVADIVTAADRRLKDQAVVGFLQDNPGFTREEAAARVELFAVLMEGTVFRRVTGRPAEESVPFSLYRAVIEQVLSSNQEAGT